MSSYPLSVSTSTERSFDPGAIKDLELHYANYDSSAMIDAYLATPLGAYHAAAAPRFSQYYDFGKEQMERLLGADVHRVEHMRYTHDEVTVPLILVQNRFNEVARQQKFAEEEIAVLGTAVTIHDLGECPHPDVETSDTKAVGDLAFDQVTEESIGHETRIRRSIVAQNFPKIPADLVELAENAILNPSGSFTGMAFRTVEEIGYFLTGIRAGYLALVEKSHRKERAVSLDDHTYEQLQRMGPIVTGRWHESLISKGRTFPYAAFILRQNAFLYSAIQSELS